MNRIFFWMAILLVTCSSLMAAQGAEPTTEEAVTPLPIVELETSLGVIVLELYPEKAPGTVENFLSYVDSGFYVGTIFHRVIDNFMVQGGGFTTEMAKKTTAEPIQNEADNGLTNGRGMISMARTSEPDSATAQFFVNTVNNTALDHREKTVAGWGYAVFGRVVEGMTVVDAISTVETGRRNGFRDVPIEIVEIVRATLRQPVAAAPQAKKTEN